MSLTGGWQMYTDSNTERKPIKDISGTLSIAALATAVSTLVYFMVGISSRDIVIISDFSRMHYVAIAFVLVFPPVSIFLPGRWRLPGFYMKSVSLLIFLGLTFTAVHSVALFSISLAPLISYSFLWWHSATDVRLELKKLATFSLAMTFMYLAASMFHLGPEPSFYPATFASVSEAYVFSPTGVPYLLEGGVAFITPYIQGVFSPLSFTIFTLISALLTENYFGIFAVLRRGNGETRVSGAAYGAVSLLSCQCEGGISLLPTMAYLVITIAMIPILAESLALLLLTNLMIGRYYLRGKKVSLLGRISSPDNKAPGYAMAAVLFLATPLLETVGIYLGMITNIFFFFGIGILMTVSAYYEVVFIGRLIGYGRRINPLVLVAMFIAASTIMFIWYFPHYTLLAVNHVSVFLLMNLTSLVAGFLLGMIRLSSGRATGQLLEEFITLMFGMPPIIVFYFSALVQAQLWPVFNITQQTEFGLIVWAIILPFMWLTTNISLNDAGDNFAPPVLSHSGNEPTGS